MGECLREGPAAGIAYKPQWWTADKTKRIVTVFMATKANYTST